MSEASESVDLHIHTTFSDGDMTPQEMVEEAKKLGLAGLAITDHDEVGGVEIAIEEAGGSGLEVISGVELSTSDGKMDIHILGYLIDVRSGKLLEYLKMFRDARRTRGIQMVERLNNMGVKLEVDHVLSIAGEGAVGRPHIAEALVRDGHVDSFEQAFRKYIGFDSPAYVPKYQLKPRDAFRLIAEAGGVGALAHPGTLRRNDLITGFTAEGMRAIEVYHPKHTESAVAHYGAVADKMGLVATGGSDTHGRRDGRLLLGTCTVHCSTIDKLKQARLY
jgi:predicted metal-dependent phosphoesterase TrpH